MKKSYGYYHSPFGWIKVTGDEQIISLELSDPVDEAIDSLDNPVVRNCIEQLHKYFTNQLQEFNLPLAIKGTPFQELVWSETYKIPYGTTITYKQLAERINHPKAVRAVGTALGKNPLAIIIPCHRVLATNNKTINYGWGKERKIFLLALEQKKN